MSPLPLLLVTLAATAAVATLAWLWMGRASGLRKRLVFRLLLLVLAAGLLALGRSQGIFAQSSGPFTVALGLCVFTVVLGNLYGVRFCGRCGRMQRNLKISTCTRCGFVLPAHGLTDRPRLAPRDATDPLLRKVGRRR
jgi:hypothetical protein